MKNIHSHKNLHINIGSYVKKPLRKLVILPIDGTGKTGLQ